MPIQPKKTEPKICLKCGKLFNRRLFGKRVEDFARWNKRKYCSKQCSYIRPEPKDKSSFHLRARKFIKQSCEQCGAENRLQVHHIDKDVINNDPSNLRTLCVRCHMKHHWRNGDIKNFNPVNKIAVIITDKDGIEKRFDSGLAAAQFIGCTKSALYSAKNGRLKTIYGYKVSIGRAE